MAGRCDECLWPSHLLRWVGFGDGRPSVGQSSRFIDGKSGGSTSQAIIATDPPLLPSAQATVFVRPGGHALQGPATYPNKLGQIFFWCRLFALGR